MEKHGGQAEQEEIRHEGAAILEHQTAKGGKQSKEERDGLQISHCRPIRLAKHTSEPAVGTVESIEAAVGRDGRVPPTGSTARVGGALEFDGREYGAAAQRGLSDGGRTPQTVARGR